MSKNNSEYWERRIANGTWQTHNALEERNRELLDFYTDASKSVKDELYALAEKHSKDGVLTLSEMHKQNRLTELNSKYEQIAMELGRQTEKTATKNMQDGFQEVYRNTAVGLGNEDFAMPNKKLMDKLLNEPWRGDSFSGRLWKNQKKLAAGLNDILLTGLQQGKTVTEMAVSLHNFMGQGFNNCHRLVRTETMHYLNSATMQRYKDADVQYVQIWAAMDERTCEVCGSYHGKVYPIDKCPVLPFHANCRCTIIPVTDPEEIARFEVENAKIKGMDTMKISIPEEVYKSSGMSNRCRNEINTAIRRLEREYDVYIDRIEGANLEKGDIFASGGFIDGDGMLRHAILFNYEVDYDVVERRMKRLYNDGVMAGKNFDDYIAHEAAHILPFQNCIAAEEYNKLRNELKNQFIPGMSKYADKTHDGAESLAEAFVKYRNGEEIPDGAKKLIDKYITPWRR